MTMTFNMEEQGLSMKYEICTDLYGIVQKGTICNVTVLYSPPWVGLVALSLSNTKSDGIILKLAWNLCQQ